MYKKIGLNSLLLCLIVNVFQLMGMENGSENKKKIVQAVLNDDVKSFNQHIKKLDGSVNDTDFKAECASGNFGIKTISELSTSFNSNSPVDHSNYSLLSWIIVNNSTDILNELIALNNKEIAKKNSNKKYNEKYIINFDAKTSMCNDIKANYLIAATIFNKSNILKILLKDTPLLLKINDFVDTKHSVYQE